MSSTELLESPSVFATRMSSIPRSCIREILSSAANRSMISFGGGIPHDSCVPVKTIEVAFERVLSRYGTRAFRYGASEGEGDLREFVASWLQRQGVEARAGQILIVNGSQQALDLLGKVFIDSASPVVVERPTYLAALQAFSAYAPSYREVPLERSGPDLEIMERQLTSECRFYYAVPSFQNPSGVCYSLDRRLAVAQLLRDRGVTLIEDDPYSQLYYGDEPPPRPICSFGLRRAVLLGTFSKMVAPGFRLGWMWSPDKTFEHLVTAKQASDLCTGAFQQLLLLETLRGLDLDTHLAWVRSFYRRQRDTMAALMERYLWNQVDWNLPPGGMFFWASLRGGLKARVLLERCIELGVAFGDGASFHASPGADEFMRLNFTQAEPEQMRRGLQIMADAIHELT